MTEKDDLRARLYELHVGTDEHHATARQIRVMILDGDLAGAADALDALELDIHTALAAGSGPGGSGLPEQWTDGGNGNVTAEADPTFVPLTVNASDADTAAMELHPAPGASALSTSLLAFFDDTGEAIADIDAGGSMFFHPGGVERFVVTHFGQLILRGDTANIATVVMQVLADSAGLFTVLKPGTGRAVQISSGANGDAALDLIAHDPTSDLIYCEGEPDYNGGEYRVWSDGKFSTRAHTAPADGDIANGECVFWFDQTDGAAKFMIKAKQADGTVKTGQVALS
jgi:hypothetical protein